MSDRRELYRAQMATHGSSDASRRMVMLLSSISPTLLLVAGSLTLGWASSCVMQRDPNSRHCCD